MTEHFESIGDVAQRVVSTADPYRFWREALEKGQGRRLTREQQQALGLTMEPQVGFWRKRNKAGPDIPVAIWWGENGLVALEGKASVRPEDVWTLCCSWPVSHEDYQTARKTGRWPDDPPSVPEPSIGHNQPDDPHEAAKLEFDGEKEIAEEFLKSPITTQQQADQAAVWAKRLTELYNRVDKMFRAKKDPIVEAGRRVDDEFRWRQEIKELATALKRHQDAWLLEQERLEQERQRKAREEAERKAREAEEARLAAERAAQSEEERQKALEEAERKAAEAAAAEREAQARKVQAGRTGAKVTLRTFVSARIVDYDKAVESLKTHPDMKVLVEQLANRAVKAGVSVPGVERVEEKRAA